MCVDVMHTWVKLGQEFYNVLGSIRKVEVMHDLLQIIHLSLEVRLP